MDESLITTPSATKPPKAKRNRVLDIIIAVVLIAVVIVLAKTLISQLSLKNEVNAATTVTNQVIDNAKKKNGKAVRDLGSPAFKNQFTADQLNQAFTSASKDLSSTPTVDRTTVTNDNSGQGVNIIYKFPNKPAFFIRVVVVKPKDAGKFQVVNLASDTSEAKLLNYKY